MKGWIKYLLLLLLPVLFSCVQKPERQDGTGKVRAVLKAVSSSTRLSVAPDGTTAWVAGDRIALWSDADGSEPYLFSATSVSGHNATFEGEVDSRPSRKTVYAIYPYSSYISDEILFRSECRVPGFESEWNPGSVRVEVPLTQISGEVYALLAGKGSVSGNNFSGTTVTMNHLTSIWDFVITNPLGRIIESVSVKASSNLFPYAGDIDLTAGDPSDVTYTAWTDSLTVRFPEGDASATVRARLFLLPLAPRSADRVQIRVRFKGGDGEVFSRSWPGSGTVAGGRYTSSMTLGSGTPVFDTAPSLPSLDEMIIYSASPRSFASSASLDAVRAQLDNIKALGCNVIWLLPIYDGSIVRQPYGSPYSNKDLYTVGSEYGGLPALISLVGAAHEKGIAVILDFITRHTGADCEWLTTHPSWYREAYAPDCPDAALFNWPSAYSELRTEFLSMMKYWIDNANVDGFRCDSASPAESVGIRTSDWTWIISNLRAAYPERPLLLLAESARANTLEAGFDLCYGWHFYDALEQVFAGEKASSLLFTTNEEEMSSAAAAGPGKARMRYSTNHDKSASASPVQTFNGIDGAMAAFAIACTMGGVPMIYSSQEIGYPTKVSFFQTAATVKDWTSGPETREKCRKLLSLTLRPSLRKGGITQLCASDVVGYLRSFADEEVLVLVNVTGAAAEIPLAASYFSASYTDLCTGEPFTFSGTTLSAYQYLILKR